MDLLAALLVGGEREHGRILHEALKPGSDLFLAVANAAAIQGCGHVGCLVMEIRLENDVVDHDKEPAQQLAVEHLALVVAVSTQNEVLHPVVVQSDIFQSLVAVKRGVVGERLVEDSQGLSQVL